MPKQWNVVRAAMIGAAIGFIFSPARTLMESGMPAQMPVLTLAAQGVGGALAGAFLFAAVTAIRNRFSR